MNTFKSDEKVKEEELICMVCHQSLLPGYYFCPNCGTKIILLSTSMWSQIRLYTLSITLPLICFLFLHRWYGLRYVRSNDIKKKYIGVIACSLLIISTILSVWYTYALVREAISTTTNDMNELMKGY